MKLAPVPAEWRPCRQASCQPITTGVDIPKEYGSAKGFFGRACSPLVESNLVILNVGGRGGASMVAFDCATGARHWQATDDEASYSSPVAANIHGSRMVFSLTREALVALNSPDGRVLFRHPWRPRLSASVSAPTPLVIGDQNFISASYGAGASLFRFKESGPEVIWSGEESLSNHYATSVQHHGFLYGWHGRQEEGCELRCVELQTGKVLWKEPGLKAGSVSPTPELLVSSSNLTRQQLPACASTAIRSDKLMYALKTRDNEPRETMLGSGLRNRFIGKRKRAYLPSDGEADDAIDAYDKESKRCGEHWARMKPLERQRTVASRLPVRVAPRPLAS